MINTLPKDLIEAVHSHLKLHNFKHKPFTHFYCDDDICNIVESLDHLYESLDSTMDLYDVTDEAKKQNPAVLDQSDISHYKVEYSPTTDETISTYKRGDAWEIHHQRNDISGEKIKEHKAPAMKFVSHMYKFVKDKVDNGGKVRISAPEPLIHDYHKLATHFKNKIGDSISITDIHPGIDIHRIGVPVHEFFLYPTNLHESVSPWFFRFDHLRMKFVKDQFGLTEHVIKYENALRKQGHQID